MKTVSFWLLLFGFFLCLVIIACEKWDFEKVSFTRVITVGALEVGFNTAFLLGDIEGLRNSRITETGFLLSSSQWNDQRLRLDQSDVIQVISPTTDSVITSDRAFAARAIDLQPSTRYFFRAYARLEGDANAYGEIDTFVTSNLIVSLPSVSRTFKGCAGEVTIQIHLAGAQAAADQNFGVVWSTSEMNMYATIESGNILESTELNQSGDYRVTLQVDCGQTYFLRGYYQSKQQVTYGPLYAFTTIEGGFWRRRSPFIGELRKKPVVFAIAGNGYIGGGSQLNPALKDLWTYDEESDNWMSLGDFAGFDVREATSVVIDDKAYIFNGVRSPARCFDLAREVTCASCQCDCPTNEKSSFCLCYNDSIIQFDPLNLSVTPLVKHNFTLTENTGFVISERAYIVGGKTLVTGGSEGCTTRFCSDLTYTFNPLNKMIFKQSPIPSPSIGGALFGRTKVVGFSILEKGYAGLGEECSQRQLTDFYEFDPSSRSQWKTVTRFPGFGESILGFASGKKGYVIIKMVSSDKISWQFDPLLEVGSQWKRMPDVPFRNLADPTEVMVIGNRSYLYSSIDKTGNNFWMYIPEID